MLFSLCALILAGCSDSGSPAPAGTDLVPTSAESPAPPQPTPTPPLSAQIGVRADLPVSNPIDLALRYRLTPTRAAETKPFAGEAQVGDQRRFTVVQLTGGVLAHAAPPGIVTISATLAAKSEHAYFYEDNGLDVSAEAAQSAADNFEASVWPTVTAAFGMPAIPGIDGDPRIIVLQSDLGGGAGGYFSSDDEYPKSVRPLSNEAEIVYLNRTLRAGGDSFNVVLAHEFQHLIQAHDDRDETAWVNEGLSEDASMLVGGAASTIESFEAAPSTQLNAWDSEGAAAHYGASAAFFRYLTSRFGGDPAYLALAQEQGNGAAGVDQFLTAQGSPLRFRDAFGDWMAANILNDQSGAYANPKRTMNVRVDETLSPGTPVDGEANQFGADYYRLALGSGSYSLSLSGQRTVSVLPTSARGAGPMIWSNAADNIDTTRTREVDLTGAADPVLTFKTWYDIERWFDWGYASVSTDGGVSWHALTGTQTSTDDPVKASYGAGYTGKSGGGADAAWVDEQISLARYAGQKVLLRFEFVTDAATYRQGWAIEDVAIIGAPNAGDMSDRWRTAGWVTLDQPLDQTYAARLILKLNDGGSEVRDIPLDATQHGELRFDAANVEEATVAVAGTTEGTTQAAPYKLTLTGQ